MYKLRPRNISQPFLPFAEYIDNKYGHLYEGIFNYYSDAYGLEYQNIKYFFISVSTHFSNRKRMVSIYKDDCPTHISKLFHTWKRVLTLQDYIYKCTAILNFYPSLGISIDALLSNPTEYLNKLSIHVSTTQLETLKEGVKKYHYALGLIRLGKYS